MSKPTINPTEFSLCAAALSEWKAAHDPDDKLGLTLSHFTPRGHTIEALVSYRTALDAPSDASKSATPFMGADDAALAAALKHFLAFSLPKFVRGLKA